jgi:hypothetical protein
MHLIHYVMDVFFRSKHDRPLLVGSRVAPFNVPKPVSMERILVR